MSGPYDAAPASFDVDLIEAGVLLGRLLTVLGRLDGHVGYKLGELIESAHASVTEAAKDIGAASREWARPDSATIAEYLEDVEMERGCVAYHYGRDAA